ncbi:MAG: hypothetical protein V1776_00045 [Candidatus Diapherotrites archaeon]
MNRIAILSGVFLLFLLLGPFAAANVAQTTMTWFVATAKSISVSYGSPCTSSAFFFPESKAEYDADSDGNWARTVPHSNRAGDSNCQTATQAGMTVANTGTATTNVDGNFASGFAGADINVVLKVWLGSTGCGVNGMEGWEKDCTASAGGDSTTAPDTSTCRNFNQFNETAGGRVVTNLATFGNQELCFSGDGNGFVSSGDHNATFQLGSDFS